MHERRVINHPERRNGDVDVVGRRPRRDAHAVVVQVGGLRTVDLHVGWTDLVDQPQLQLVAAAQAEDRRDVLAVIDVGNERLIGDSDRARRRLERQLGDTMVGADDLRLDERRSQGLLGRLFCFHSAAEHEQGRHHHRRSTHFSSDSNRHDVAPQRLAATSTAARAAFQRVGCTVARQLPQTYPCRYRTHRVEPHGWAV